MRAASRVAIATRTESDMDLGEMMKMLKDPKALERQALEAQARMASVTAVGSAGGGMVRLTLNGAMELVAVELSPEAVDPAEIGMLQDLIRASRSMGGLDLSGLGLGG